MNPGSPISDPMIGQRERLERREVKPFPLAVANLLR